MTELVDGVAWTAYDPENRAATTPPNDDLVLIREWFYEEGTTVGFYDGSWRLWTGSDDVSVSHWAPLALPDGPTPEEEE